MDNLLTIREALGVESSEGSVETSLNEIDRTSSPSSGSASGSMSDPESTSEGVTLDVDVSDELLIEGVRRRFRRLPKLLLPTLVSENTRLLGVRTELLSSVEGIGGTGDNDGKVGGGAEVITVDVSGIVDIRSKDDHEPLGRKKEVSNEVSGSCNKAALVALGDGASKLDSYDTFVSVAQG